MKKQDTLNHIRSSKGYVPYVKLFGIFNDEDEIPQTLIDISCMRDESRETYILCGSKIVDELLKFRTQHG